MFSFIGDLLGSLGGMVVDIINGVLRGVVAFFTRIVDSLGGFVDILDSFKTGISGIYTGFLDLLGVVFPFLPSEWTAALVACLLLTIVGVVIKRKVFD